MKKIEQKVGNAILVKKIKPTMEQFLVILCVCIIFSPSGKPAIKKNAKRSRIVAKEIQQKKIPKKICYSKKNNAIYISTIA